MPEKSSLDDAQDIEPPEEKLIIIHSESYPDDSLVIEMRPESRDQPWEDDFVRLSRKDAEELFLKLEDSGIGHSRIEQVERRERERWISEVEERIDELEDEHKVPTSGGCAYPRIRNRGVYKEKKKVLEGLLSELEDVEVDG